jgi:hypothetical protein
MLNHKVIYTTKEWLTKIRVTYNTSHVQNNYKIMDHLSPTQLRPKRGASIVVFQIPSYWVIVDISGTCNQNISIYTVVMLTTFT